LYTGNVGSKGICLGVVAHCGWKCSNIYKELVLLMQLTTTNCSGLCIVQYYLLPTLVIIRNTCLRVPYL